MRKFVWLLAGSLAIHSPASADFVYDPDINPIEFECDEDQTEAECAKAIRFEAWWQKYEKQYDYWDHGLLFTTDAYFAKSVKPLPEPGEQDYWDASEQMSLQTRNLVDAVGSVSLRRYSGGWAFAISFDARLRMVHSKRPEEVPPEDAKKYADFLPTTLAETAESIGAAWHFDEANLRECKGAIEHLLLFPAQKGGDFWSNRELEWMPDYVPDDYGGEDEFIVTMDGNSVFLRARSVEDHGRPVRLLSPGYIHYEQANGGVGYEWAHEMREIVGPCLKPSKAIPPWKKFLAAQIDADAAEPAD